MQRNIGNGPPVTPQLATPQQLQFHKDLRFNRTIYDCQASRIFLVGLRGCHCIIDSIDDLEGGLVAVSLRHCTPRHAAPSLGGWGVDSLLLIPNELLGSRAKEMVEEREVALFSVQLMFRAVVGCRCSTASSINVCSRSRNPCGQHAPSRMLISNDHISRTNEFPGLGIGFGSWC